MTPRTYAGVLALSAMLSIGCSQQTATAPGESCDLDVARAVAAPATPLPVAFRVLVFTKTAGYHHPSIATGTQVIVALGAATGFAVDTTSMATAFTASGLAPYRVIMFLNTTGDVLNAAQQSAFEQYMGGSGNWVGVHSATDTEYDWPWYQTMLGTHFASHSTIQPARVVIADGVHTSTIGLPVPWTRDDEWYNFASALPADAHVLLRVDERSYSGGTMGADHPIAWTREVNGARTWYTALGHTSCSYVERAFLTHLRGGILWAAHAESLSTRPF